MSLTGRGPGGRQTGRMAERLAPEQTPLPVTSRPERARGRVRRFVRRLLALVVGLSLLAAGTLATLHFLAINRSATEVRATALVPEGMAASVLVVLARPGQELPLSGTLAALDAAGASVSVLSLTDGGAQPPHMAFAAERLGAIRSDELASAGDLLGVDRVTTADYPDGALLGADPDAVTATIAKQIDEAAPSVVLTVSDATGTDSDSQAVAAYTLAAAQAEDSGVARVWTVTRGDREVSWNALARAADRGPRPGAPGERAHRRSNGCEGRGAPGPRHAEPGPRARHVSVRRPHPGVGVLPVLGPRVLRPDLGSAAPRAPGGVSCEDDGRHERDRARIAGGPPSSDLTGDSHVASD